MIYPADFERTIGFDRIREALRNRCRYESSALAVDRMPFLTELPAVRVRFNEADQWRSFAEKHPASMPFEGSKDILGWLHGLSVENYFFSEEQLFIIRNTTQNYERVAAVLYKNENDYPLLVQLLQGAGELKQVVLAVDGVLNEKGLLKPNASVAYSKISTYIERLEKEVRSLLRSLFRSWRDAGYTADTELTVREERTVVPIKAEFKRKINGFVKDISATGQVLYIEPVESLELNNRLKELYAERRRERERILLTTTDKLRPYQEGLANAMDALWKMDFIAARVSLASTMHAQKPTFSVSSVLSLRQARNPLLQQEKAVPLDLDLDSQNRLMIISGPNAGGKSVALKTAFLLQYMVQHGLAIPALPESVCGIFTGMMMDCGDGQSIEAGLSTFSAHLTHLKAMTEAAKPGLLFGIDEIGNGTDPRFGGPIAQTILETLLEKGATGIVTTHFSRLKEWAGNTDGVINAGMAYDTEHLQPFYRLIPGKPGSSFALQLLRKTGFSSQTIKRVESLSGEESGKTEELLLDLEQQQQQLSRITQEFIQKEKHLSLLLEEYHLLKSQLESRRKEILEQSREKAGRLLQDANKQIEKTIREIKEQQADKEKTQKIRQELNRFQQQVETKETEVPRKASNVVKKPGKTEPVKPINWLPGMAVNNVSTQMVGEVIEVKKEKLKVAFGLVQVWMPKSEAIPANPSKQKGNAAKAGGFNWVERNAAFSPTLDLRGMLADQALQRMTTWMEEAYALGQFHLKIIHGRGDGILRKALRQHFKTMSFVRSYHSEHEENGGDGCTIVELF